MLCTRLSVRIRTSCILFFRVHTGVYEYIPGLSQYIQVCTRFMSVHTVQGLYELGLYQYILVCTRFVSVHKVPETSLRSQGLYVLKSQGLVSGT
jgi:hypothetical protein